MKLIFLWLNLERTLDKLRQKVGLPRRRQLKNVITFQIAMSDKNFVSFFSRKNRVTPSVAARVIPTLMTPLAMRMRYKKEHNK